MTDYTKLIERLREPECENHDVGATGVSVELLDWDVLDEAADAIEALQWEVERLKALPMKYKRMEFNAQLQEENAALRAKLDELQRQEPVEAIRLSDTVEGSHPSFGRGAFATLDSVGIFYAAPKALEPLTDRFAEAYWKACDSSQPLEWMEAALAAQQILQTNRPETKGTP